MTLDAADFSILLPAFVAGLLVTATHVPLGTQVLARAFPRPHDADRAGMRGHIGRDGPGRLFAVADLGSGRFKQSGAVAGQHRRDTL